MRLFRQREKHLRPASPRPLARAGGRRGAGQRRGGRHLRAGAADLGAGCCRTGPALGWTSTTGSSCPASTILAQSPEDRIGTLTGSEAINVVIRSFLDFSGICKIHPGNALRRDISLAAMDFAQYANRRADTGRLHCTLHGEF